MGLFCGKRCQDRKDAKVAGRTEVKLARIEGRTDRVGLRQETKQVAYANGIDPNAAMWGGISSAVGSAAGLFGGGPTGSTFNQSNMPKAQQQQTMMLIGAAALVAFFIFKK